LSFERWKYVRDGLADLWEWWGDCAHLRPQVKTDRWRKSVIKPPFVEELIRWAAPLTAEENETLPLESSTSIDAHLGDALCQICAMVHFYVAVNEGLELVKPGVLEYVESEGMRKCQRLAKRDQIELVLFAPGSEGVKSRRINPTFKHYFTRINSAYGSPLREFPSRAILNGVCLTGADLSFTILGGVRLDSADLSGADLSDADLIGANLACANLADVELSHAHLVEANLAGANLSDANLSGASLSDANLDSTQLSGAILYNARLNDSRLERAYLREAIDLTLEQIESAWINEQTRLPEELEKVKPEILERQRLRTSNEMATFSPGAEAETPEIPIA
jgi:uncharacterized protein YjbI with pentapeptide repeats